MCFRPAFLFSPRFLFNFQTEQLNLTRARIQAEIDAEEEGSLRQFELRKRLAIAIRDLQLQFAGENELRKKVIRQEAANEISKIEEESRREGAGGPDVQGIRLDDLISAENKKFQIQADNSNNLLDLKKRNIQEEVRVRRASDEQILSSTANLFGAISAISEENSAQQKAFAVAQALINTYQGATKALTLPPPASFIQAAATIAFGLAQVKNILSTDPSGQSTSSVRSGRAISSPAQQGTIVQPRLTDQFSQSANAQASQAEQTANAVRNAPSPVVRVSDINKVDQGKKTKVSEGSL